MEEREQMVAFWLVPAVEERDFFAALIDLLAVRFDAPRFEPHVTLFGGTDISEEQAIQVLEQLPRMKPIKLYVDGVEFSEKFTKTLFVQFDEAPEASGLTDSIRKATGSASEYQLNPHLSLVYKKLPQREKAEVADSLEMPFEVVTFDAVKVITGPAKISGREDVEAWKTIGERRLAR